MCFEYQIVGTGEMKQLHVGRLIQVNEHLARFYLLRKIHKQPKSDIVL